jgi:hypothetical protein
MMEKRDSGLSIAVGFVMILLVIAMIIGMWAVVGVPEQIRDAEEYHAVKVTNAFLDYKIAVDSQRTRGLPGSEVSMLIPAASAYADGALFMQEGVGTLRIYLDGNLSNTTEISRLYATFGTTNTRIGYEAGGVYRNDYGRAAWVTPPSLSLEKIGNDVYVNMVVPKMQGSFAVGSSEGIPVDTRLQTDSSSSLQGSVNQMMTITYEADQKWDAILWSAFFNETKIKYGNIVQDITVELTADSTSIKITPLSGGSIHLDLKTPEYQVDVRGS